MAKRKNGVGKMRKTHSHKTKKRLEIKKIMLEEKRKKDKNKKPSKTTNLNRDQSLLRKCWYYYRHQWIPCHLLPRFYKRCPPSWRPTQK